MDGFGLVQVYTGEGKGKTTAALGLALRATGHGFRVYIIQFMKGRINYGELESAKRIRNLTIVQFGRAEFVDKQKPEKIDIDYARRGLDHAKEIVASGKYDMVVLDEINVALEFKLIPLEEVLQLIKNKPKNVELILTGRYAHPKILELADLVSEIKEVKHPYQKGIQGRRGIEY